MASDAPARARTSRGTLPSARATRGQRGEEVIHLSRAARATRRARACPMMMARSVRPALGATAVSSRPNISRNTTSYRRVPSPSALSSV